MSQPLVLDTETKRFRDNCLSNIISESDNTLAGYSEVVEGELNEFIQKQGMSNFWNIFRLSANIPESIVPDSSHEKIYSKFTDTLLSLAFKNIGLTSSVLTARSDSADVVAVDEKFNINLVADAKAFRLSRTAKNQKDFKIQAMNSWKQGRPHAILVCPIYQAPARQSQIYFQSIKDEVLILGNSHIAFLGEIALSYGEDASKERLAETLEALKSLHPSKSASDYWIQINKTIKGKFDKEWQTEKQKIEETILFGKQEALEYFAKEKTRILRLSKDDAIRELLSYSKIESKIKFVQNFSSNNVF